MKKAKRGTTVREATPAYGEEPALPIALTGDRYIPGRAVRAMREALHRALASHEPLIMVQEGKLISRSASGAIHVLKEIHSVTPAARVYKFK